MKEDQFSQRWLTAYAQPLPIMEAATPTVEELLSAIEAEVKRHSWSVDDKAGPSTAPSFDSYTVEIPRRTHRRSRIRQKWAKRYGTKTVRVRMYVLTFGPPKCEGKTK